MSAAPAGAAERIRKGFRTRCLRFSLILALGSMLVACSNDASPPATFMDGSPSREPPVELEGVSGPAALTRVRVVDVDEIGPRSLSADCLRTRERRPRPALPLVERIGVTSTTVTFAAASDLYGCDDSPGPREEDRRWCSTSFGRLYDGRLRDPRLDIAGCRTAAGEPMGFVWVEPDARTRYVAVEQEGYTEVYETAGSLPVRIATTTGVEIEGSRASFHVSEHDASGRLVRRYTVDAVVAG